MAQKNNNAKIPVKRNSKKEKPYFYIMRRGVCFGIFLFSLVWLAIIALSFLNIMPKFTGFWVKPDYTPLDQREDVVTEEKDDEGNPIVISYKDKTEYVGLGDPIYGAIAKLTKKPFVDAEGNSKSPFFDEVVASVTGEPVVKSEDENTDQKTDEIQKAEAAEEETSPDTEEEVTEEATAPTGDARSADSMLAIAKIVFPYFPLGLALGAIFCLIILILSFLSLFGRRIFKGFAIFALIMVIVGLLTFVGGFIASGDRMGNPKYDEAGAVVSIIDFSKIGEFITGSFSGAPATAPAEDAAPPLSVVAGISLLVIAILPILILLLSFFTKRKVPYSIFDR